MKKLSPLVLFFICITLSAQSNTDVFLLGITKLNEKIELVNLKNISNNEGYNNQPSFYDINAVLFSSTRNTQTDIKIYNIKTKETSWITNTALGSEYSPLKIPNKDNISAIRLDKNGLQRLYQYDFLSGKSKILLKDLKVAYHTWYNATILVSATLVDDRMDLVVSNLKDNTNHTLQKNIGRSLHKIPNSNLISFISDENETSTIKSLNPISGDINTIKSLPIQIKDMCWLSANTILIPNGKIIAQLDTTNDNLSILHHFKEDEINEISRIAVSNDGKHLAIVSEESPTIVVQKQVEAFNKGDLVNFASCYSENVVVKNYPHDTLYVGNAKLKSNYIKLFSSPPKSNIKIVKRLFKSNIVIDEQLININGKEQHQVAVYEIKNGKIASITFIHQKEEFPEAEAIVRQQLVAFNAKNIDNFVKTFSNDIKAYDYPNKLYLEGQKQLSSMFSGFFSETPDLHCDIKNRIIIGNIIIDEEYLTANGDHFDAVVIYEIEKGKIAKMTSIR